MTPVFICSFRVNGFLLFAHTIFFGNQIFDPSVEYRQVEAFSIHTKGDLLNIDGENTGQTPIEVSMVPNALEIFADL